MGKKGYISSRVIVSNSVIPVVFVFKWVGFELYLSVVSHFLSVMSETNTCHNHNAFNFHPKKGTHFLSFEPTFPRNPFVLYGTTKWASLSTMEIPNKE